MNAAPKTQSHCEQNPLVGLPEIPEIHRFLDESEKLVNHLEKQVSTLTEKISPVCCERVPKNQITEQVKQPTTPLGERIYRLNRSIETQVDFLDSLQESVGL